MRKNSQITVERARELLNYNPATGILTWKVRKARMAPAGSVAGTENSWGHVCLMIDGVRYTAHRIAWLMTYGCWPSRDIDHINRIPSDNRMCNLREVSQSENNINQGLRKDNASGFKGVSWHKGAGKWNARIKQNGKRISLGLFSDPQDASLAYQEAVKQFYPKIADAEAFKAAMEGKK